ncbi:hypothetical protein P1J78_10815 [Psychromarinibacter sp. C21-152]|uniref:Uncharacterized protein n=1 Tax=Psychromarinibacter sediminicola TaxID=3033385 RepID=A0AAE3NRQ6_9RHOB|nr:hypothetical protein [Psychromarinibacter sediminicola]MDF0601221.1 hypothetical protein [Psychromarinibacter sediminicola]
MTVSKVDFVVEAVDNPARIAPSCAHEYRVETSIARFNAIRTSEDFLAS